ncbi:recombinase family protein [Paenibacillus lautus]|uniref:recombinase family protein n=1 Tax=Paenibacillus lautus TaxID=1401 RepID=UPI002041EB23|nr:recombinase family protein [Paenibacillus lautus]MCM3257140.1 recombinase family protein [Paenibacillus lautus]
MYTLKGSEKFNKEQLEALITKIKAIVYARVSSDGQVEKYSIDSQIELCVALAKQNGIGEDELVVLIEDGESGDNPNRPMINYVCFLLEYGIGDYVIFLHPDRMSRLLHLQGQISNRIWGLGKDMWFVEFDLDKSNPESMLNFNIQGSIAEYNKAKILANTKRGRITKIKSGKIPGINRIYGYTFDTENDTLVVNEKEKAVYLKMVEMLLVKEYSVSQIARELSLLNFPAPLGGKWYQATVSRILRNETYKGTYYHGKTQVVKNPDGTKKQVPQPREEWRQIDVPSFITEGIYKQILSKLEDLNTKKTGRPSGDYLLRGIARCGRCGGAVSSGVTTRTKTGILKYYTCQRKAKKSFEVGTGISNILCRGRNWRVDIVDEFIWKYVLGILSNPKMFIEKVIEKQADTQNSEVLYGKKKSLLKMIKDKEGERDRYTEMYAAGIIKNLKDVEDKVHAVDKQIEELKEELLFIEKGLTAALGEKDNADLIMQTLRAYEHIVNSKHLTIEDKRKITGVFIERVTLNEGTKIEIKLNFSKKKYEKMSDNKHEKVIACQSHGGS